MAPRPSFSKRIFLFVLLNVIPMFSASRIDWVCFLTDCFSGSIAMAHHEKKNEAWNRLMFEYLSSCSATQIANNRIEKRWFKAKNRLGNRSNYKGDRKLVWLNFFYGLLFPHCPSNPIRYSCEWRIASNVLWSTVFLCHEKKTITRIMVMSTTRNWTGQTPFAFVTKSLVPK